MTDDKPDSKKILESFADEYARFVSEEGRDPTHVKMCGSWVDLLLTESKERFKVDGNIVKIHGLILERVDDDAVRMS